MRKIHFLIILLSIPISLYSQQKRLALVIGNSAYEHGGVLKNPVNDAFAMKRVLSQVGFDVQEYYNLNQGGMKRAIDDFGLKLKDYDVGLFFYAGHGIQAKGNNYLIPVDANLRSENDVEYDCIDAGRILGKMEDADNRTNIIILDACRNNPFERSWSRSVQGNGLASMDAPIGSIVAYATAPGTTASDGDGKNGLYTSALLNQISNPGLSIEEVFKRVRMTVVNQSNEQQTPWESTSLIGDFYFSDTPVVERGQDESTESKMESESVIERSQSITGAFIDGRDSERYSWIQIGDHIWLTSNVNFASSSSKEKSFGKSVGGYGLLYTWEEAVSACPKGWHLPSDYEWKELEMYMGMTQTEADNINYRGSDEGKKMKTSDHLYDSKSLASDNEATNESGLSITASAMVIDPDNGHEITQTNTSYWTSTETPEDSSRAWFRLFGNDDPMVGRGYAKKFNKSFIRCVKD